MIWTPFTKKQYTPFLICGSRSFCWGELVISVFGQVLAQHKLRLGNIEMVGGKARGADWFAWMLARCYDLPLEEFPPEWDRYGYEAGPLRNELMAWYCHGGYGIAFWDGTSRGTADMIRRAEQHHIKMRICLYEEEFLYLTNKDIRYWRDYLKNSA